MQPRLLALLTAVLLPTFAFADCSNPIPVSKLLAETQNYDENPVCATGKINIEFEENDLSEGNKSIWLGFFKRGSTKEEIAKDQARMDAWAAEFQGKCVYVNGHFSTATKGHFGMWPAGINSISNITAAPKNTCKL
ncbi:hypothetical protein ACFPTX_19690 [Pseudomonas sp. GCM10022188]|uniref:hypothetical protein n=1 Tax=Pseudomonas TaxID=286 RepID=UPI001E53845A|nr:hypothetical protein [Pseudomonas oryzagri]MCC6073935.1 hypothetical protein [Pseudomonas oryzagri]